MSEQALSLKVRLVPEGDIFTNAELTETSIISLIFRYFLLIEQGPWYCTYNSAQPHEVAFFFLLESQQGIFCKKNQTPYTIRMKIEF